MSLSHACHAPDCAQSATERCFECGKWFCDAHRTAIVLPTFAESFREEVCATCLLEHAAPGPYGPVAFLRLAHAGGFAGGEGA
jgi:hypothetical protein